MTPSKILLISCLSFIIGTFFGSLFSISQQALLGFLFLLIVLTFGSAFLNKMTAVIFCCLFFVVLGIFRFEIYNFKLSEDKLAKYSNQKIELLGKVVKEPSIGDSSVQLVINVQKILLNNQIFETTGKILLKPSPYPEYNYSDLVTVKGSLTVPENFSGFDYQNYLARDGIFYVVNFPQVSIVSKKNYQSFWEFNYGSILDFKNLIRQKINQNFPYLQAKLLSGIMLGDQSGFPKDFKDKMSVVGLSHITAISGMNIAILCSIVMSIFLGLGLWRGQAFYLTLIFIFLFVLMVGPQPSIVRAAIMGSFMLLAQKLGRLPNNIRIIAIVAAIMIFINPTILRWDVGFQLSFLAILGIIILNQPIEKLFNKILGKKAEVLKGIIATTLAAQVFTMPILIYNFGRVSLIAPLTNVLVVPVVDTLMILGFIFAFLSLIFNWLGWVFVWPCWLILTYVLKVVDIFSQPWAVKYIENLHWIWLAVSYLLLTAISIFIKRKERASFLNY